MDGEYITDQATMFCPVQEQQFGSSILYLSSQRWSDPGGTYGNWGSDAQHIFGGYAWFAGFDPARDFTYAENEKPWANNLDQSTSEVAMVAHMRRDIDTIMPAFHAHDQMHNGAGMSGSGGDAADLSTDSPVGMGDGHAEVRTKDQFKVRVLDGVNKWDGIATGTVY